jgi:puromycin-sensitive aminopeptidase
LTESSAQMPSATRLSKSIRPTMIDLQFELDPKDKTFRGSAQYTLQLDKRTREIELHAADLHVTNIQLRSGDESSKPRVEVRLASEMLVLHFDQLLPSGPNRLELEFSGQIRNDLRGLYRSVDETESWLATQLCPTDARRFFPCFDEPGIKSPTRIRVTVPSHQAVLSNAPIAFEEQREDGRKTVQFETTPPLSAYLIAVAVGPFSASPVLVSGSTEIRVHTLPGRQRLSEFARATAGESLARLERWFDMPHPYAKLDLVALPDFAFGAMENAGAVFFRDSVLLLNPEEASVEDLKRTAETITHEISHMWFGNLVTMAWWNDLWLNESFATWMAYEIIEEWRPEWQIWLDFAHRREEALSVDALASSHPIAPEISSAEEAHENFDAITYTKGACVLRMLQGFLGRDVFRDGIRLYIQRHREGVATASDLWAALAETTGAPVEAIVAPWTLQTGFPLVSLRRIEEPGDQTIELRQQKFLARPAQTSQRKPSTSSAPKTSTPRWQIPWIGSGADRHGQQQPPMRHLFVKSRDRLSNPHSELKWLYGNAGETGFFRIEHGPSESEALLANLSALATSERIGLIGHQWALVRSGRRPISDMMDLLSALGEEKDPDVLFAAGAALGRLSQRLVNGRGPEVGKRFRSWLVDRFGGQFEQLGLELNSNETLRERMRRAQLFGIVGYLGHSEFIGEFCVNQCAQHFANDVPLPAELAREIMRIAASRGDEHAHRTFLDGTRRATTPQDRRNRLFALAEFDQPELLQASLAAGLDSSLAPVPDRAALLGRLLGRPTTAEQTWQQLKTSWPRLEQEMPPILLARLVAATADALPFSAGPDIEAFFKRHSLAAGSRILRQIAEEMSISEEFAIQAGAEFEAVLAKP